MECHPSYGAELRKFILFLGRGEVIGDTQRTKACLVNVAPEDICRYFNLKAYGEEFPSETSRPVHARSNTLKSCKKMLSYFMPRKNIPWYDVKREGNPTRAIIINNLIKRAMKYEVRQQGVKSQARRPIEFAEFLNALTITRASSDMGLLERFRLSSILTMQWHLIGRVDDMMKLQFCNFSFNPAHLFTLICQMRWSKNILEERESPRQILLGSMDERLCVLLNLAVYVELIDSDDPERVDHGFLFGNGNDGDRLVRDMLHRVLENAGFKKLVDGNLGTHSIRKGPATYASRNGMSRENIELRGRWRGHKKQVDTYIDIDRPLPDANAASCLCGPSGAVLYSIENTKWCTDSFLCEFIAPNASKLFTPQVGAVLAKPLLYAAVQKTSQCDPEFELIPDSLRQKILHHVHIAGNYKRVDDIQRLVTRIPITIRGFGDELIIDEIGLDNTPSVSAGLSSLAVMKELNAVGTMVMSLKRRIEEIETSRQNDGAAFKSYMDKRFDQLHSITKRIAQFPVPVPRQQLVELAPSFQSSRRGWLSKRPRDLYDLWQEYEFGLGGSKPAKEFTSKERGACKWIYSTRLAFWKLVTALINRNHTSDTAIDAVYGAYGRSSSVTHILSQIRVDKSSGHFRGLLS